MFEAGFDKVFDAGFDSFFDYEAHESEGTLMERLAQCHCGSLRATTSGEPLAVALCHCQACQRRTGALASPVAGFEKARVAIEGDTKIYDRIADSGRKVRFYFCPTCGTSLYWEADARQGLYILAVGAFADPNFPAPSVSIFEETMHTWMQLPDGMKHFPGAIISGD
jgi:hypothetical protein